MTLYIARLMHGSRALTAERFAKDTFEGARLYAQYDFMRRNMPNGLAPSDLTIHLLHKPDPMVEHWAAVAKLEAIGGRWVWSYPPDPV